MTNFILMQSADEIVEALNGDGYEVRLSPTYTSRRTGEFKAPSIGNMNRDGLRIEYCSLDYPNKKYDLFIENEYEIEEHKILNVRLIRYMLNKYGRQYLDLAEGYVWNRIAKHCKNKSTLYKTQRFREEVALYRQIYNERFSNKDDNKKETEVGGGIKSNKTEGESE